MEALLYLLSLPDIHILQASAERNPTEIIVFRVIEAVLLFVRFVAIIYFIFQAWLHSQYSKEKRDPYTFYSFLFLGLSLILFFINRLSVLVENLMLAIYETDEQVHLKMLEWLKINSFPIIVTRTIVRVGLGYLF